MTKPAHTNRFSLTPLGVTARHLSRVLPQTERALDAWRESACAIPDETLRAQALASIDHKRFHCQGGTVFAAWHPSAAPMLVRFIVSFQTISDYLDNLCDRTDSLDAENFRWLHRSMLDAVTLGAVEPCNYYAYHPQRRDGGYLDALVKECQSVLSELEGYRRVEPLVQWLVSLYIDLQVYKHVELPQRVPALKTWFAERGAEWSELNWWEFAAAAGSTLGVFALVTEGARRTPIENLESLVTAYFPWICALHILLDYLIDQEEDRREQDLNFVSFYCSRGEAAERLGWILKEAFAAADKLVASPFHYCVIEGLLGLYLTDPKVKSDGLGDLAEDLVAQAGWRARLVRVCCRTWRVSRTFNRDFRAME